MAVGATVVVEVSAAGHEPARRELRVDGPGPLAVEVTLAALPTPPTERPRESKPARESGRPPPPREQPRGRGTLQVRATPYWGQVTVDGRVLDEQTPLTVQLPAGLHDVVVSHPPRGLVKRFKISIAPGETVTRSVTFD